MKTRSARIVAASLASWMFLLTPTQGQAPGGQDPWREVSNQFRNMEQIGGPEDETKLGKDVWKVLVKPPEVKLGESADAARLAFLLKIRASATDAMKLVAKDAEARWATATEGSADHRMLRGIREGLRIMQSRQALTLMDGKGRWDVDDADMDWGPLADEKRVSFREYFDQAAKSGRDAKTETEAALRLCELTYRCMAHLELIEKSLSGWDAAFKLALSTDYLFGGIPQWFWELPINDSSTRFANVFAYRNPRAVPAGASSTTAGKSEGESGKWTWDGYGLQPPKHGQWIIGHLDVAMEYMDGADPGQQFKPAVSMEALGFDLWAWDKNGKRTGPGCLPIPIGAGVVANLTDRGGKAEWGVGGVIHLDSSYNLGVVFYDDDPAFFVSVNLGKKFNKYIGTYDKLMK